MEFWHGGAIHNLDATVIGIDIHIRQHGIANNPMEEGALGRAASGLIKPLMPDHGSAWILLAIAEL